MPTGTASSLRWDGFACSRLSEVWDQPFCDDERVREGEADGLVEPDDVPVNDAVKGHAGPPAS